MQSTTLTIVLILLFIVVWLILPRWRMRRAVRRVVAIFQQNHATHLKGAMTPQQLGLRMPRGLVQRMLFGVDYKAYAFQGLIQAGIVRATDDGRYYLLEEKAAQIKSKWL
ncbi:MAG: hypothetical protein V1737_06285 [Chloroflexota bacterium]